jgi:putative ABC transport system permease protein
MDVLIDDLRYALRALRRSPAFAAVAILSLGVAIGADTTVFSVVDALLVRPLPYAAPSRLATIRAVASYAEVKDLREQARTIEEIGAYGYLPLDLTGKGEPVQVDAAAVTEGLFAALGVPATLGRWLTPEDDAAGTAPAVVVSQAFWRAHLGGDPSVVGRTLTLSSRPYTVVGVMPPGFAMPADESQLWVTMQIAYAENVPVRNARFMSVVVRLREEATRAAAQAELNGLANRMKQLYPDTEANAAFTLVGLQESVTGQVRPALLLLLGAVSLVLLVACANFANLLLARSVGRHAELAVRAALGADRLRIVRQLLTESVLVALLGGVLGVLLSLWAVPALVASNPSALPVGSRIHVDERVLAFTFSVSLFTGIAFGLLPALRAARVDLQSALNDSGRSSGGAGRNRLRSALVVSELAMALLLLAGAVLLLRSFASLQAVRLGFDPDGVSTAVIDLPPSRYPQVPEQRKVRADVLAAVQALPGVRTAGLVMNLPMTGGTNHEVIFEGQSPLAPGDEPPVQTRFASRGFFEALRIPLVEGRLIDDGRDVTDAPPVVVVNQALVRKYLAGRSPVGLRLRWAREDPVRWLTVVGVVGDVADVSFDRSPRPTIYVPFEQETLAFKRWSALVVRSAQLDSRTLAASIKNAVWSADPLLPVTRFRTMDEAMARSLAQRRFTLVVLAWFAGAALFLAAIGVYGVVAYSVAQRTHEIGVRMALGAPGGRVARMFLVDGAHLALFAVAIGVPVSLALGRVSESLLYGVAPSDAATHVASASAVFVLALVASWLPARRASRIDPMIALRSG